MDKVEADVRSCTPSIDRVVELEACEPALLRSDQVRPRRLPSHSWSHE